MNTTDPYNTPQQPPAAYQATAKKRNWTGCYVAACSFVLLLVGAAIWLAWWGGAKLGKGFVGEMMAFGVQMQALQTTVANTPLNQIKNEAQPVDAAVLAAAPSSHSGKWLVVEGELMSEPTQTSNGVSYGPTSQQFQGMSYMVKPMLVVIDVSNTQGVAHTGDIVRAYGQVISYDLGTLSELPIVGKEIEKSIKDDPQFQQQTEFCMFIAKQVELVKPAGAVNAAPEPPASHENTENSDE